MRKNRCSDGLRARFPGKFAGVRNKATLSEWKLIQSNPWMLHETQQEPIERWTLVFLANPS